MPEECAAIQRDLECWRNGNLVEFNKSEMLHLGRNSPRLQYLLGAALLESRLTEKDMWILVETKLNRSQKGDLAAKNNEILGCI